MSDTFFVCLLTLIIQTTLFLGRETIAKNQNTFAKRQREMDKRFKAQEKRAKREERKNAPPPVLEQHPQFDDEEVDQSDSEESTI